MTAHELAMTMVRDVLAETGITATAGIGTNLYLAKIAMDIVAKRMPPDKDGVRVAELDEMSYRRKLWAHTPITDLPAPAFPAGRYCTVPIPIRRRGLSHGK